MFRCNCVLQLAQELESTLENVLKEERCFATE